MLASASDGHTATTSASSGLSRVGRRGASQKTGLEAHSYRRPAPEMNVPHPPCATWFVVTSHPVPDFRHLAAETTNRYQGQ